MTVSVVTVQTWQRSI